MGCSYSTIFFYQMQVYYNLSLPFIPDVADGHQSLEVYLNQKKEVLEFSYFYLNYSILTSTV